LIGEQMETTRGIIAIHSASVALRPHLEWAVGGVFGHPVEFDWVWQPAEVRTMRTDYSWQGPVGTGAKLASALRGCEQARFEVTEEGGPGHEGLRWAYTPRLGVFSAVIGPHGDIMIHEDRLRAALVADAVGRRPLSISVHDLLGAAWDEELEAFRRAAEGAPVRWLHVG
jgi:hypothetical protein